MCEPFSPLIPDDVQARRQQAREQARHAHEQKMAYARKRDRFVNAGNRLEDLGREYEVDQRADEGYLKALVAATADFRRVLAEQGFLEFAGNGPADLGEHERDAREQALAIFHVAESDPAQAIDSLKHWASEDPDFAMSLGRWLRQGIRKCVEARLSEQESRRTLAAVAAATAALADDADRAFPGFERTECNHLNTPEQGGSQDQTAKGMTWQDVAGRLKRLRAQGEPWTSQHEMARRFCCSSGTVNKAIRNTPELLSWAKREVAASPRARSLSPFVTDRTAQSREPDPREEAAIREYLERDLRPDERAFFNGLSREDQIFFLNDPDKHSVTSKLLGRKP